MSMTPEEKQLLLKDLCARLPYGVKCQIDYDNEEDADLGIERYCDDRIVSVCVETEEVGLYEASTYFYPGDFKPYLRPLSSMTKEEREYLEELSNFKATPSVVRQKVDFYLEHHLDYRGLIPMGLALEAPEGMYKIK